MEYKIREILPRDNAAVEALVRFCLTEHGATREGTALSDPDLDRFSEIYSDEKNRYWVAEDESGKIVGGVGIGEMHGAEGVCELRKMYCYPEARGTGVAHRLLTLALDHAKKYYKRCYLETLPNMKRAQSFYKKYGFVKIDTPPADTGYYACEVKLILDLI